MEAKAAYESALGEADELLELVELVEVPAAGLERWLPERLSFMQARGYFRSCLRALNEEDDLVAGQLARSLFEETIRWSWIDEDRERRRGAFLLEAARRHRQFVEAMDELGVSAEPFFGEIVAAVLREAENWEEPFPRQLENHLDWGPPELQKLLYAQYRLLSQYTHSSLLAAASTATASGGNLLYSGLLPLPARMSILRNACGNIAFTFNDCRAGLLAPDVAEMPFYAVLIGKAAKVTEYVQAHSPGSA
jgi:hypothetical protein